MPKMWGLYTKFCRLSKMWWPRHRSSTAEVFPTVQIWRVSEKSQEKSSPQMKLGRNYSNHPAHILVCVYAISFSTTLPVSRMMSILNRMLVHLIRYYSKTGIEFDSSSLVSWQYHVGLLNQEELEILLFDHLQQTL